MWHRHKSREKWEKLQWLLPMWEEGGSSRKASAEAEPQQGEGERERPNELRDSNTNTLVVHLHSQLCAQVLTPRHSPATPAEARKERGGERRRMKNQDEFLTCSSASFRHPSVIAKPQTKL